MSTGTPVLSEEAVRELASGLRGPLLRPQDDGYDLARQVHNGLIDRRPAFIARCTGVADVVHAVNYARDNGLTLSVRGGGHNVAGKCVNDGGLVIDLSMMKGVFVDPRARVARVQGGATWGDLDRETQVFGLATPGGVVSTTGVAGLTLHGGFGHLRHPFGLSLDNVVGADIVTADGRLRSVNAEEDPDLLWAIRGAGSNFGVVTSFLFRLHPVGPTVTLSATLYDLEDAPSVLRQWRDLLPQLPNEFTPIALFWSVPEGFPPEIVGRPIVIIAGVHIGALDEGERATMPLRSLARPLLDMSGPMPFTAVQTAFDPFFPQGRLAYWKSTYVDRLTDPLIDTLCDLAARRPSPRTTMDVWPMGSAAMSVPPEATAFGERHPFMIAFESTWTDPADNEANVAWAREAHASMASHSASGIYLNFPGMGEGDEDLARTGYGRNYPRLARLKARYDPNNLFRMNINIVPEGASPMAAPMEPPAAD